MSPQGDHPSELSVRSYSSFRNAVATCTNLAFIQHGNKDELLRLLDHAQSGSIEKKRTAAGDLPGYIQKVPEMQDDIVNAVYDLCEDSSVEVSIVPPVCYGSVGQRFWVRFE